MRIFYIEDEVGYAESIKKALESKGNISVCLFRPAELNELKKDHSAHPGGGNSVEEQITKVITKLEIDEGKFDAALIDTDLSGFKEGGISQSAFRTACAMIGLPVLRYSRGAPTTSDRMKYLTTIAREGSQALQVPLPLLQDGLEEWVLGVAESFNKIQAQIENQEQNKLGLSPSEILAAMLKVPDLDIDLLGYSGANFFFFGDLVDSTREAGGQFNARNYASQLGYWIANYVLMFPGPILNDGATAAYLGITKNDITKNEVRKLLKDALYDGPFSSTGPYYIRRNIDQLLTDAKIRNFPALCTAKHVKLDVEADENKLLYYCVVNDAPIAAEDARGPFDWIPRGADICRIKKDTYDKLAPWLNV